MTGDPPSTTADRRDPGPAARQGLDSRRRALHRRLDQLEELARARATPSNSADEPALRRRLAELEAEADHRRREQQAALEQLDHDRRLLADAWERLEQETLRVAGVAQAPGRTPPGDQPAATTARPEATFADRDDPVARAILRQFQALRRDVRRNASKTPDVPG